MKISALNRLFTYLSESKISEKQPWFNLKAFLLHSYEKAVLLSFLLVGNAGIMVSKGQNCHKNLGLIFLDEGTTMNEPRLMCLYSL